LFEEAEDAEPEALPVPLEPVEEPLTVVPEPAVVAEGATVLVVPKPEEALGAVYEMWLAEEVFVELVLPVAVVLKEVPCSAIEKPPDVA